MKIKLLFAFIMLSTLANAQQRPPFDFCKNCFQVTRDLTGIGFVNKKLMIFTIHVDVIEKALQELTDKIVKLEVKCMPNSNLRLKEYTLYFKIKDSLAVRKWGNENL